MQLFDADHAKNSEKLRTHIVFAVYVVSFISDLHFQSLHTSSRCATFSCRAKSPRSLLFTAMCVQHVDFQKKHAYMFWLACPLVNRIRISKSVRVRAQRVKVVKPLGFQIF
jgi:hypothetical protein